MKIYPSKFFYKFENKMLEFFVKECVYYPQEDSVFFADFIIEYLYSQLEKSKNNLTKFKKILEIGCGCGFLLIIIYKFFEKHLKNIEKMKFVAVDIDNNAVENTKINAEIHNARIEIIKSNLFDNINEKFDLILFNSPYLPVKEDYIYSTFQGGKNIINRFLKDSRNFIKSNGRILLLVSSLTTFKIPEFYKTRIVKKKKLDWEELRVYEIKLR